MMRSEDEYLANIYETAINAGLWVFVFVYGNEDAIDDSEINNEFDWSTVCQVKVIVPTGGC